MIYAVCPTCGFCLADKEVPYTTQWSRVVLNPKLSDADKQQARRKILDELGVRRYCCRMRMMSSIHEEQKLVPRTTI